MRICRGSSNCLDDVCKNTARGSSSWYTHIARWSWDEANDSTPNDGVFQWMVGRKILRTIAQTHYGETPRPTDSWQERSFMLTSNMSYHHYTGWWWSMQSVIQHHVVCMPLRMIWHETSLRGNWKNLKRLFFSSRDSRHKTCCFAQSQVGGICDT